MKWLFKKEMTNALLKQNWRRFIAGAAVSILCGVGPAAVAHTAVTGTGFYELDNASIPVKYPGHTPLISIVRTGLRLVAVGAHGVIVYSDDSGATWTQAKVPVSAALTALYFASDSQGWAVGHYGVILATTDGGATWSRAATGLDVIKQLDTEARAAQADSPQTPADALKLKVEGVYRADGPNKPFLAVGPCGGGVIAVGHQDMAMFSPDGGASWRQWTSQFDGVAGFHDIYRVLGEGATTFLIGEDGFLLKSTGGCANFSAVPGPYSATLFGGLLLKPGTLMVYGLDGGAYISADDGASWKTIAAPGDAVLVAGVALPSGQVLLGTIRGALLLSDSQFQTMRQLALTEPFQIDDMAVAPNGNVIVVGNGGVNVIPPQSIR